MSEQAQDKTDEQGQQSLPDAHTGQEKSGMACSENQDGKARSENQDGRARGENRTGNVRLPGYLLGLIVIAGMGGLGWKGYQIWQELSTEGQNTTSDTSDSFHTIRETLFVLTAELNNTREQHRRLVSRMDNLNRQLVRLQGSDRSGWLLAEAEYLLRLANQRLLTMRDVKSAMTLLSQADQLLITVDEYGLFPVSQALAEDIAALRAVERFDLEGTWLRINALMGRIDQLPLLSPRGFKPDQPEFRTEEEIPASKDTWQQHMKTTALRTWHALAGQFRIRTDNHKTVAALLPPSEELYLRQNLRLMLEQARLALMQGQEQTYQVSLANAQAWLQTWFRNTSAEVVAIHDQLDALQQIAFLQELPDISRSVIALKGYVDDLTRQRLPVTPAATGKTSTSGTPATTRKTSTSSTPATTGKTSTSRTPAAIEKTSTSSTPAAIEKTSTSRTPAATGKTSTSRTPAAIEKTSTSRTPAATGKTSTSRTPAAIEKTSTSRTPAATGKTSTTNNAPAAIGNNEGGQ